MFTIKNKQSNFEMKKGYVSKAGNTLIGYYYIDDGVEFIEDGKGHYIGSDLIAVFYKKNTYYPYCAINFGSDKEASGLLLKERIEFKQKVENQQDQIDLDGIYAESFYDGEC